jgi:beta-glucosidase
MARAVRAARRAHVAVVFANDSTSEGMDRTSLALPGDQNRLINAVAAANRKTVVVLNTGGAALMPWIGKVAGVVEAWYPGQENGNAIAAVLFGDVSPSGRLPITFPRSDRQTAVASRRRWPGVNGVAHYDEGLRVGYRWYDATHKAPLFPFGYGLSYTRFRYARAHVGRSRKRNGPRTWPVSVRVRNTGRSTGAEIVQLYVGFPRGSGEPPKQLKGFKKVDLRPGHSARVTFHLTVRDLSSWSSGRKRWTTHSGRYRIMIGSSSRNIRTSAGLRLASRR